MNIQEVEQELKRLIQLNSTKDIQDHEFHGQDWNKIVAIVELMCRIACNQQNFDKEESAKF